jgi:hypothetical protein
VTQEFYQYIDKEHPLLKKIFDNADKYELQIRYTQIERNVDQIPIFTSINLRFDSSQYFYPASTVKMPAAFLALEKINEINSYNPNISIDRNTTIIHEATGNPQTPAYYDSTSSTLRPSLAHYIDKLFVVSDNDAYNRVYEFLGQDYANQKLRAKGIFSNSRIVHRVGVSGYSTEDNKRTNPFKFLDHSNKTIYSEEKKVATLDNLTPVKNTLKGLGYFVDSTEQTVMEPFDMSEKNFINIEDLETALMRIVFPSSFDSLKRFNLTRDQYSYLYESMLKLPKDFEFLNQDSSEVYYDGYVKFFLFGDIKEPVPDHIKIMNKVGYAYGYLTDCAYIFDTINNLEFFLTATVHVNDNQIYNDGIYEYEEIGIPFLAELGRQIYQYELERDRTEIPLFDRYFNY